MAHLDNPKHEAFAQYLHEGYSANEAYVKAGYAENRHNAANLARKQHIRTRLGELHERTQKQTDVTLQSITDGYREVLEMARSLERPADMKGALDSLAKLHGLWVDKQETEQTHRYITDEPMQADAWEDQYAAGDQSKATH